MSENRHYPVKSNKRSPQKRHHPPSQYKSRNRPTANQNFFQGNIANNMNFGGQGHDLSGYVQRTLVMKDRHGNVQIAKEKQFFNSSKNGMSIRVHDDEKD